MELIIRPRQGGKTTEILQLAKTHFAYIVAPTRADVQQIWEQAQRDDLHRLIPMPITWDEFITGRYRGQGIKAFVIDDLDRCLQQLSFVPIIGISLTCEE